MHSLLTRKHSSLSEVDIILSQQKENEGYCLSTAIPHLQIAGYHLSFCRDLIP